MNINRFGSIVKQNPYNYFIQQVRVNGHFRTLYWNKDGEAILTKENRDLPRWENLTATQMNEAYLGDYIPDWGDIQDYEIKDVTWL